MKALLTLVLSLILFNAANACECIGTMKQSYENYPLILRAKVVSLADTMQFDIFGKPVYTPFIKGNRPKLKVNDVYKGKLKDKEITLSADNSMCNFLFQMDKEYVIFIWKMNGELTADVCSHTFEVTDNKQWQEFEKLYREKKPFSSIPQKAD